jgi:outer membrane protein assembly factor BamB
MMSKRRDPCLKSISPARRGAPLSALVAAVLLAGCATGPANTSWPGLAVQGEVAYLAFNNHVAAVNTASGLMIWQYPPKGQIDATLLLYADPLVDSQGRLAVGSYDGSILQLDPETGNLIWRVKDNPKRVIAPILEGPDGNYYVAPDERGLLVLDPADGSTIRQIDLEGGSVWGEMAADGGNIYAATLEHKLFAVRAADGQTEWIRDLGDSIAGGVRLLDGTLYLGTVGSKALALDSATGGTRWEVAAKGWVWQPPVPDTAMAYVVDVTGTLQAVSRADGGVLWTVPLGASIQTAPVVTDGMVVVGMLDGQVRAFSAADGSPKWEQKVEGSLYGALRAEGDRLLVTVFGGAYQLASLLKTSGSIQWTYAQPTE